MKDYKILYEERKVQLSPEFYSKMKYLVRGEYISTLAEKAGQNMKMMLFYDIFEEIAKKCFLNIEFLPERDNEINYNVSFMHSLAIKFKELLPNSDDYYQIYYDIRTISEEKLGEILDISYNLNEELKKYYFICDLINAKNDCIENMKYFLDKNTISQWSIEYEEAIQTRNIKKMQDMLEDVQNSILKEWEKYLPNIENMNDDNFSFLGHSTNSTKFENAFYSKYVSTSLLTQDINDTYRSGYGFIFAPKNIVGANANDMYVNNYAENQDMLLHYSTIKKIDHPKRLIEKCKKQKQENLDNSNDKSVYNEVVIDGFDPIGIFCFTDGSKSLNLNEINAKKLQENFPNLKIYTFDIMNRKKGPELTQMKLKLINNLKRRKWQDSFDIQENMLDKYEYFFIKFNEFKHSKNYDETMIEAIFNENLKMLSVFNTDPDDLFKGEYSEEQIKYILTKNIKYNIGYIFGGNARAFTLNNLKELIPYKNKISSMFDGIDKFLELISKIEITDEMMQEINELETINFITISKYLTTKLIELINAREQQTQTNINNFQTQYNELLKELQAREKIEEQHEKNYKIYLNRFYVNMIKDDYIKTTNDLKEAEQTEKIISQELDQISKKIEELEKEKELINNSKYEGTIEHIKMQNVINEIQNNIKVLSKHPLINIKKLKDEKKKLHIFEIKDKEESNKFENDKINNYNILLQEYFKLETRKNSLEFELEQIQSNKKNYEEQLISIKSKIKEDFICNSIEEIDKTVAIAEQFIQNYDFFNPYYLKEIKNKLNKLNMFICEQQQKYNKIQEEKSTISIVV